MVMPVITLSKNMFRIPLSPNTGRGKFIHGEASCIVANKFLFPSTTCNQGPISKAHAIILIAKNLYFLSLLC
jgi:hypothetical protein